MGEGETPDKLIDGMIALVVESLDHAVPSPKTRELRARAESFQRALDRWSAAAPAEEQRAALRDVVGQLYREAMDHEKRHKSYRSIRVGANESGMHRTAAAASSQEMAADVTTAGARKR